MFQEIKSLLIKELQLEWKQKYAINGLLLYVLCMVIVIALAFLKQGETILDAQTWNVMFWLIMLFASINAVAKSFMGESEGQLMYMYGLASPAAIIIAKTIYNAALLIVMGFFALLFSVLLNKMSIANIPLFLFCIISGSVAFAANLTMVSAIAAKTENKSTLLAVLSFPLVVPILLTLIRTSQQAIAGFGFADVMNRFFLVWGISGMLMAVSVVLFPFIWRD